MTSYKKLTPVQILDFQQKTKKEFVKYNHYGECVSSYMNVKEKDRFYRKVFHIKVIQRNGIATAKEYNNLILKKYGSILSFANNFHSKSNIYFGHTCIYNILF
ncbi:hypothetical protein [Lebetimonas sp. JH292]|uniref:hypothetical protein n=1 Tax=Lebetimonas sp. JH292 TaxID=990068 RepID=UPI000463D2BF|nr:hypothetical protein [Lebetimonas sp. JH292]